jgi:hypothetical protein
MPSAFWSAVTLLWPGDRATTGPACYQLVTIAAWGGDGFRGIARNLFSENDFGDARHRGSAAAAGTPSSNSFDDAS